MTAAALSAAIVYTVFLNAKERTNAMTGNLQETVRLPEPKHSGRVSVEEALFKRRSVRDFREGPISAAEVSQLLWAAQGITGLRGFRTTPSAGALYPLELYVVAGNVDGLPSGVFKYVARSHELVCIVKGDRRSDLCDAALGQPSIRRSAAVIVISGVYGRTTAKYGERGVRYVHMEAGHAAQNVWLQAVSLGLGTVVIGAFHDAEIKRMLRMADGEEPLYIMPVGRS